VLVIFKNDKEKKGEKFSKEAAFLCLVALLIKVYFDCSDDMQ